MEGASDGATAGDRDRECGARPIRSSPKASGRQSISGFGRLLASHTPPEALEEKIFEIVNQLNRGARLITSRGERERVAELNLIAGKRAKGSTAYASALAYLAAGAALLTEESWSLRSELTFALELHRAECEYLTGELSTAEERLAVLSRHARNVVDFAAVTCVRMALYMTLDQSDRSVEACLEYLRRVGFAWSPHPTDAEVRQEYERMWRTLGGRPIEELLDLPPMTDPDCRATIDVLSSCDVPALFSDKNLLSLLVARIVNLSLEHGNSDASCLAYVRLGSLLGSHFGDYRAGFRFGKLGLDLMEKRATLRFKARVYFVFWYTINPWTRHARTSFDPLRRGFHAAQEIGDLTYSSYLSAVLVTLLLTKGDPLDEVQREAEGALEFTRKAKFGLVVDLVTGQLRFIRTLRGLLPDFGSFNDDCFDEGRFERRLEGDPRLSIAAGWYWLHKLQARCYAGDHASALEAGAKASLCSWCVIDVVEGREIQRISWAHRDPTLASSIRELERRYPPGRDSPHPAARVLRSREPLLLPEISEAMLREYCEDEGHVRLLRELGTHSAIIVPLVARAQPIGTLTVVSSVPERRYGDADLELVQEVARRAAISIDNARLYRAAQEAIRARDEFLTVATHELNTPMTSLTLSLEAIARVLQPGRAWEPQAIATQVDRALRQAARLTRLNNELLDVSRIHAHRLSLEVAEVDLGAVVRDVIARLGLDLERAGCSVSLWDSGRIVGFWDRARIDQIVTNLLANAMKFGAGKPVDIFVSEEAGTARRAVKDHGIGFDPARQEQIFERFGRAVSDWHYGGLGLGLYIRRRIVDAHGGSIRVRSALGAGATFLVELPCAGPPRLGESSAPPA